MRKLMLSLFLLGITVYSANAQLAWGGRVGFCYSTISEDGESINGKPSLEIGPTVYYALSEKTYINSGIMLSIKNFNEKYEGLGEFDMTGYYLDVPLYYGYAFSAGSTSLYAQAGPYIGFKVHETSGVSSGGDYYDDQNSSSDELTSFNYGLGLAAGINLNRFKIEAGYQYGLANAAKESDNSVKIGSVFLGVSYIF